MNNNIFKSVLFVLKVPNIVVVWFLEPALSHINLCKLKHELLSLLGSTCCSKLSQPLLFTYRILHAATSAAAVGKA